MKRQTPATLRVWMIGMGLWTTGALACSGDGPEEPVATPDATPDASSTGAVDGDTGEVDTDDTTFACPGAAEPCLETCDGGVELGDAVCERGTWTCPEGVAASSCEACDGEEPLECIESCEEGQIYEAECIDDAWDCGDGALLESCAASCGDEIVPCLDQCGGTPAGEATCTDGEWSCVQGVPATVCEFPCGEDPILCVPSCDVFEIYDGVCTDMGWSCGDGVLAADC